MLGIRESSIYGSKTYENLKEQINSYCNNKSIDVTFFQSNIEGEIINCLHDAYFNKFNAVIINPAAYTHYSYAILDALKSINLPTIEVHISNIHNRDDFRKTSVTASACIGQITGFGFYGYIMAISYFESIM